MAHRRWRWLLCVALACSLCLPVSASPSLEDAQDHGIALSLAWAQEEGILLGTGPDQLTPDGEATRAMAVTVLLEKLLPAATCLEVLDRCAQVPMLREVFRAGVGYLSQGDYETLRARYAGTSMLQYHLDTRQVLPGTVAEFLQADPRPVEELFFLTGSPQEKAALRDLLTGIQGIGFADPFPNDLEVIAGDIDKGEALRFLLRHLGLEASQVLAMGDGGSDLPLLQAAGIGVAMANATEGVKAAADFVTTSCDEDGVAVALEKFVL